MENQPTAAASEKEAELLLAHMDWAMISAWKAKNPKVLALAKAILDNDKLHAPPPPPLVKASASAIQVTIFDNHAKGGDKKKSRLRFGSSVKVWVGDPAVIDFKMQDPAWTYTGDLLDAKGLKDKAAKLQKTTGYGKVGRPISDAYRDWLIELANTCPDHHFVPLMQSGKFGRRFPEGEVLVLDFQKNGNASTVSGAWLFIGIGASAETIHLNEFVASAAGSNGKTAPLSGNALLQSRTGDLPRWATPPFEVPHF